MVRQTIIVQYRKHLLQANYVLVVDIKTKTLKTLNLREWECPYCFTYHDRDMNASFES